MNPPTPQPTSAASPDPLHSDVTLPRIPLDSMEDFDHVAAQMHRVLEELDEDDKRMVLAAFSAQLNAINPNKQFDPEAVFRWIKQMARDQWTQPALNVVKDNVTIANMPFDQCLKVEPVSLDLHERLVKVQADRDEALRQVVTMRATHPANYETMIQDSIRLTRKMNIERAAQVEAPLLEPFRPPLQGVTAQGMKDLEEALEFAVDAWKPVDESA